MKSTGRQVFPTELVQIADLKPHPRNYRDHPPDQITHITHSIEKHGFYRNVVIAEDGTILAGHGVVLASKQLGMTEIPAIRLRIRPDSSEALKVLTGDNEISKLGEVDDRALTDLLKHISEIDVDGLLGTGFDPAMLSGLVYSTRPEAEIQDKTDAAAWAGLPDYDPGEGPPRILISFRSKEDRLAFVKDTQLRISLKKSELTWTTWWPFRENDDTSSLRID